MIFPRPSVAVLFLCATALAPLAATGRTHPGRPAAGPAANAYKGAIILDAATGKVLFEDNADVVGPPASMTKLMTFAVLHDKLAQGALTLQIPVTITAADSKIGGTQVWLKQGEIFPVEELIYAMMIQSANDAAYALARTTAGSVPAFVELMNAKARELGMVHSTFRTPHGLPPANRRIAEGDLTTPRDFALLCRYLLQKTDVVKYTSVKRRAFGPVTRGTMMDNHDHLLTKIEGVDGLKTGFTNGAGFCLATTALRNGRRVIVIVMDSPDSKTRDLKVAELIERGFAALPIGSSAFTSEAGQPATSAATSPVSAAPMPEGPTAAPADDGAPVIKFALPPAPKKK